jgi:hypothetical protein
MNKRCTKEDDDDIERLITARYLYINIIHRSLRLSDLPMMLRDGHLKEASEFRPLIKAASIWKIYPPTTPSMPSGPVLDLWVCFCRYRSMIINHGDHETEAPDFSWGGLSQKALFIIRPTKDAMLEEMPEARVNYLRLVDFRANLIKEGRQVRNVISHVL